jgi:hypothetical protein
VIEACFAELEPLVGTAAACRGSGKSRATHYRRLAPPVLGPPLPRSSSPNALSEAETTELLAVLRSPRFCDLAPAQIWAMLLDEGTYLASISTMYRVLRACDEVRERRAQAKHPARARPELMADRPNMCWTWDITKLRGPDKGVWFDCYVIIDVRHEAPLNRVGWKDPPAACRSRPFEAGGSLILGAQGKAGAAPTKAGWAGTARRPGPAEQDGKVYERNQCLNPLK